VSFELIEKYVEGKLSIPDLCEDLLIDLPSFKGIIDGATAKTLPTTGGKSPGLLMAEGIATALQTLEPDVSAHNAIKHINSHILKLPDLGECLQNRTSAERPSASIAIYSAQRDEVWLLGDVSVIIDGEDCSTPKIIDEINAGYRSMVNQLHIQAGVPTSDLLHNDLGRKAIMWSLSRQGYFQNNTEVGIYAYGVVDGTPESISFLKIIDVSSASSIILASDGYPVVRDTVAKSEAALLEVLHLDPLMIDKYKSTKGMQADQTSFDDRAYMRLEHR